MSIKKEFNNFEVALVFRNIIIRRPLNSTIIILQNPKKSIGETKKNEKI